MYSTVLVKETAHVSERSPAEHWHVGIPTSKRQEFAKSFDLEDSITEVELN